MSLSLFFSYLFFGVTAINHLNLLSSIKFSSSLISRKSEKGKKRDKHVGLYHFLHQYVFFMVAVFHFLNLQNFHILILINKFSTFFFFSKKSGIQSLFFRMLRFFPSLFFFDSVYHTITKKKS